MHLTTRSIAVTICALFVFAFAFAQWPRQGTALQANTTVAVVSAGNYQAPVTPDSIAALFGVGLSVQTGKASTRPLPTTLAGLTVRVNNVAAGLFFVSSGQINFLIPASTAIGTANISVTASDGSTRTGAVEVANAAPSLFTFNGNGQGVAAAVALRVRANNTQSYEPIAQLDAATNRWQAAPLNLGPANERLFLLLYASGARGVAGSLRVLMGGLEVTPSYVGASSDFFGVEQINVELTRSLVGRGRLNLSLLAPNTRASNVAEIDLANVASDAPGAPTIASVTPTQAVAGETLTITGTGFSTAANGNAIIIGGVETRTVESATATRIVVRVPFGVGSGKLAVRTALGEGLSANPINALTTVSGVITDTQGNPLPNVAVSIANRNATTRNDGSYTVKDVPAAQAVLRVDPTALPLTPKLPVYQRLVGVLGNRDNLQSVIALQPPDNSSVQAQTIPTIIIDDDGAPSAATASAPAAIAAAVTNGGLTFDLPDNSVATLPPGVTDPRIYLTRVENSRAPAQLPRGVFSSALAQLSPFGIRLSLGGKLTFPNPDGWAANSQVTLYRLNQTATSSQLGTFVAAGTATVSADGQRIETAANAITEASIYFVANARPTTTVIGRVVDSDTRPVRNALIVSAGQLALTDGNGSFVVTSVPVPANAQLSLEASFIRPTGRTDRVARTGITALAFSTTRITTDLVLPSPATQPNQPPSLTFPPSRTVSVNTISNLPLVVSDPENQAVTVAVTGATFASIVTLQGVPNLRLAPGATAAGNYTLTLRTTDSQSLSAPIRTVALTVLGGNRQPVLTVPAAQTVAAGQPLAFDVSATDPDAGQTLVLTASGLPTGATFSPTNAMAGRFTWTPNVNQVGIVTVSFSVSDGSLSDTRPVSITVTGATIWTLTADFQIGIIQSIVPNNNEVYIARANYGVSRSQNNGSSWEPFSQGLVLGFGVPGYYTTALAARNGFLLAGDNTTFLPIRRATLGNNNWAAVSEIVSNVGNFAQTSSTVYAATDSGFYGSSNDGQTWTKLSDFRSYVVSLGTNGFYAINGSGVFRSTDAGASWVKIGIAALDTAFDYPTAIIARGTELFVGTSFSGIYYSADNGLTWTPINGGVPLLPVSPPSPLKVGVARFLIHNNVVYACLAGLSGGSFAGGGILRLNDGATKTWEPFTDGLTDLRVNTMAVGSGFFYAGTTSGKFYRRPLQ